MAISPYAGKPVPRELLVDLTRLEREYYERCPDWPDLNQLGSFGPSGPRASPLHGSFTEAHILAITQAICDYRHSQGIDGPLYRGKDTHARSEPAQRTALEVLAANAVETIIQQDDGVTPTPVISWNILVYNRDRTQHLADGIVITPSHNPPEDGGFKYNPPSGGPADTSVTGWVQDEANRLLGDGLREVRRAEPAVHEHDYVGQFCGGLGPGVGIEVIRGAGLRLGVAPLGGSSVGYWPAIAERWGLDLEVANPRVDPTFAFMPVDWDGKIRMDCSSPYAMAGLIGLKDRFDVAFANDPDADRHGIVTPSAGLLNPNHVLAVAIRHLPSHRPCWPAHVSVGKTPVSSC